MCPNGSQLRQSQMREIDRTRAQPFEQKTVHRFQSVFLLQKRIFKSKRFVICVIFLGGEQSCLTKEQRFNLHAVVPMFPDIFKRQTHSQPLERIAICSEAEIAG